PLRPTHYAPTHSVSLFLLFFYFNHPSTTHIYTLSLHDALPISLIDDRTARCVDQIGRVFHQPQFARADKPAAALTEFQVNAKHIDRKSTRLNSSHSQISYAVFCLKKKKKKKQKEEKQIHKKL